ncbi:hypothetical protein C6502_21225 [Candidatus Poribacteria bacterium]|nr:MAG: hypothetical protein C6502_21225 [Candidatus Poribacteria bacterium]
MAELLRGKDQIQNVSGTIAVGVRGDFTVVSYLHQTQDINSSIAVAIGTVWDFEVDFAIKEQVSFYLNQMSTEP